MNRNREALDRLNKGEFDKPACQHPLALLDAQPAPLMGFKCICGEVLSSARVNKLNK